MRKTFSKLCMVVIWILAAIATAMVAADFLKLIWVITNPSFRAKMLSYESTGTGGAGITQPGGNWILTARKGRGLLPNLGDPHQKSGPEAPGRVLLC